MLLHPRRVALGASLLVGISLLAEVATGGTTRHLALRSGDGNWPPAGLARRAAIFRSDNRTAESRARGSAYAPIGVVANESLHERLWAQGTGFLVSTCHVLTTAHNVVGTAAFGVLPGYPHDRSHVTGAKLTFLIGQGTRWPFAEWVRARVVVLGRYDPFDPRTRTEDYALLELDDCVGQRYGFLGAIGASLDMIRAAPGRIISAGYPAERDHRQGVWVEDGCTVTGPAPDVEDDAFWGHDCAASAGMSGGPLMVQGPDGRMHAVAMHKDAAPGSYDRYIPALANGALPIAPVLSRIRDYVRPSAQQLPLTAILQRDALVSP
jgi:hypothetical protein